MRPPPPPEVRRAAMHVVALLVKHGYCDEASGRQALEYFAAGDHLMANHTIAAAHGNRKYEAKMARRYQQTNRVGEKRGLSKSRSTKVHAANALLTPICGSRSERVSDVMSEVTCKTCLEYLKQGSVL